MTYSIEKVTTLIGARRFGERDTQISFILSDSRSLCFPEETLFFALRSGRNDGHRYINELYARGVQNFVVSTLPQDCAQRYPDANFLLVLDTLEALQRLAERHRDEFNIPIVGITGSNGKTMVKEWLNQLLSGDFMVTRSPRSYNSQVGVPLSVWLLDRHSQVGIFEAGISKPGEMLALRNIIQPTIAVLTNIGDAHQENFSSREAKCMEKLQLFHDAQVVVYNGDDVLVKHCVSEQHDLHAEQLFWSCADAAAPFYINKVEKLYRTIDAKLATRQFADLRASLKEHQLMDERKSMFEDFDKTFLNLFPHFITRYNQLFDDAPANEKTNTLTTEMRIFALIRLGINDSERIAKFLHYSIHTINTYKTRVKNKSKVDNDQFEAKIMEI